MLRLLALAVYKGPFKSNSTVHFKRELQAETKFSNVPYGFFLLDCTVTELLFTSGCSLQICFGISGKKLSKHATFNCENASLHTDAQHAQEQ
uniref:Uncharacterized protein n=1 Tax=Pyxicephalus adspersus TaxID=30357 RepID=A0AAV3ADU0_PYXAD|nr:TPA: hypothetical protein GDO54_014459 [Pyxicephalus adspersus]